MKFEIIDEEREILIEILKGAQTSLEIEWHRTDDLHFRESLKHRSEVLDRLIGKVEQPAVLS